MPGAPEQRRVWLQIFQTGRIEPIAGARIFFKLRPELVHSHPLAYAKPKVASSSLEPRPRWNGGLRRGHVRANIIGWQCLWRDFAVAAMPDPSALMFMRLETSPSVLSRPGLCDLR